MFKKVVRELVFFKDRQMAFEITKSQPYNSVLRICNEQGKMLEVPVVQTNKQLIILECLKGKHLRAW